MMKSKNKIAKYLAILIVIAILTSTISLAIASYNVSTRESSAEKLESADIKMLEEISNITGVKVEEIMKLREKGQTWNEILETLKKQNTNSGNMDNENNMLIGTGLSEEFLKQLEEDGYSEKEILDAKLLVERLLFQLREITKEDINNIETTTSIEQDKTDLSSYRKILDSINKEDAISLMLKLKSDFGSIEKVLDEYILSLQLDINLQEYLTNKDKYINEKDEKMKYLQGQEMLTLLKIEEKAMETIMESNDLNVENNSIDNTNNDNLNQENNTEHYPQIPSPNVDNVKPKNPGEEIKKEIESIDPKND